MVDPFTARARLPNLKVTSGHTPTTSEATPFTVTRSNPVCWTMMLVAVIVSPLDEPLTWTRAPTITSVSSSSRNPLVIETPSGTTTVVVPTTSVRAG
jgi:hypothetical protein